MRQETRPAIVNQEKMIREKSSRGCVGSPPVEKRGSLLGGSVGFYEDPMRLWTAPFLVLWDRFVSKLHSSDRELLVLPTIYKQPYLEGPKPRNRHTSTSHCFPTPPLPSSVLPPSMIPHPLNLPKLHSPSLYGVPPLHVRQPPLQNFHLSRKTSSLWHARDRLAPDRERVE